VRAADASHADTAYVWSPDADVFERRGLLVTRIDLPGTPLSAIRVEVSEDEVIVSGQRPPERREASDAWSHAERPYGRFSRVISLPAGACPEEARATFKDGVLEITVPVHAA
jgi:HSP20 family protein